MFDTVYNFSACTSTLKLLLPQVEIVCLIFNSFVKIHFPDAYAFL